MSTAATSASMAAIAAASAADAAKSARCAVVLRQYDPSVATVEQMREYASCVRHIYGTGGRAADAQIFALILLVAVLAGAVGGAIWGARDEYTGPLVGALLGILVCCGAVFALGIFALLFGVAVGAA